MKSFEPTQGIKFDTDKLQYSLIEPAFLTGIARVLTHGAEKYAPENWKYVTPFKRRYTDALMRHFEAWRSGECVDTDSRCLHLSHLACNAMFLQWGDANEK